MCDSLLRGRHHTVIGSDDDDGNIRHLSTTGTHSSKGLVTRGIQKGNAVTVLQLHVVSTDVLGNTASLTGNNIGVSDMVKQRSLTMVNVSHHGNDRSTRNQIVLVILFLGDGILHLGRNVFGSKAKLVGYNIDSLSIQTLVDTYHDTDAHTSTDYLVDANVHHCCQLRNGYELRQFEHL